MSGTVEPEGVPPGVVGTPQGDVVALGANETKDYARLVFSAPRFEQIAIAEIIQPSVTEAVQAVLPSLVPPYVNSAANAAVAALAVQLTGSTMSGPLNLSPTIPTAPSMAASKSYVDTMVATSVPEVPPVPIGASWLRQTGQWTQAGTGGTVTSIATTGGITGGPITTSGTIQLANMAGNTLKGNNTGSTAAPTDLTVAQTMTMLGAAPLNSPAFSGTPQLPTGTAAVTQPGGTNNTSVATTAFVNSVVAAQYPVPIANGGTNATTAPAALTNLGAAPIASPTFTGTVTIPAGASISGYAPLASPTFTGTPSLPTGTTGVTQTAGDNDTSIATTQFVTTAVANGVAAYLPLVGGTLTGPGNLTVRGGVLVGAAGSVPAAGALMLNANTVAPPTDTGFPSPVLRVVGPDATNSAVCMDGFSAAPNYFQARQARGTAAAPTATQNGDTLLSMNGVGRGATVWSGFNATGFSFQATENWTDSARGSSIAFRSTVAGGTTVVNSLILGGNLATFSGDLTLLGSNAVKASGTTWANPSARDLKENIQPYQAGLQAVLALQPRTWDFAADSGIDAPGPHIGLVYDETAHMPEMHRTMTLGSGDEAREVDGLDCSVVTWALVNAVKELNTRLAALETPTA